MDKNGKVDDGKVDVEVDLSPETIIYLALEAHKLDITLNEYCNRIFKTFYDTNKKDKDGEVNS